MITVGNQHIARGVRNSAAPANDREVCRKVSCGAAIDLEDHGVAPTVRGGKAMDLLRGTEAVIEPRHNIAREEDDKGNGGAAGNEIL